MASDQIRLVVLDMGSTLWEEVPDDRAVSRPDGDGHGDCFYRIDSEHMFRYEGTSNRIYRGVRAMFAELHRRRLCVSINSINTPDAWRWIESDIYDLNTDGFVRHSRIGERPDFEERDRPEKTNIKGTWTAQIIGEWNAHECTDNPITHPEVLFIDDDEWNLRAVERVCPGVHCRLPPTSGDEGMLDVVSIIDQINNGESSGK